MSLRVVSVWSCANCRLGGWFGVRCSIVLKSGLSWCLVTYVCSCLPLLTNIKGCPGVRLVGRVVGGWLTVLLRRVCDVVFVKVHTGPANDSTGSRNEYFVLVVVGRVVANEPAGNAGGSRFSSWALRERDVYDARGTKNS